jgi:CspA family cold shock protein
MSADNSFSVGKVKWFNSQKAFGFISLPEGGMDIFVHANQLRKSGITRCLLEGEQVKFHISTGDKGQYATDISVITGEKS